MFYRARHTAGISIACLMAALFAAGSSAQSSLLKAQTPILIPGGPGGFYWMLVDSNSDRVFATHKGTKSVAIVDLKSETAIPSVKVGTAQGVAVDTKNNKIYLGNADEKTIVVLDSTTYKKITEIMVKGPVDDVIYCPKNGMIYADNDDGQNVWVINPKTDKIVATIKIPPAPEKMVYDNVTGKIYQNIKSNHTVQVIDPDTNSVIRVIPTAPATGPHGIAIDGSAGRLYSAGSNGRLVVIDLRTDRIIAKVDIEMGVDQIAYDRVAKRIYCACKGSISVVEVTASGAKFLGNVPTPKTAHTIAVDPKTHAVWTCYFDDKGSYLLKLTAVN